jgi:hypothetical protein
MGGKGSGGARNRSGPPPDPTSGRSETRGFSLQALPTKHKVRAPKWPLAVRKVMVDLFEDGKKAGRIEDVAETERIAARELELWRWAWRQPQAAAWIQDTEAFRIPIVAMWVRTFVICESGEATAADKGSIHRFADQIGMTTAGLAEMGWKIVAGEAETPVIAASRDDEAESGTVTPIRRLRGA